jgi:hypothetical protein
MVPADKLHFLFVEVSAAVLFVLGFLEVRKRGWGRAAEFAMIFLYGLILEELDMRFFKSYHYGEFYWKMGGVPVSIALLWAVIVAGCMAITDASGMPETARPFADGVLALWLDLSLDAIAIRLGYWHWTIPLDQGWFGVPAGNLYAWLWVAFFFSVLARAVRLLAARNKAWNLAYLAVPPAAYTLLFAELQIAGFVGKLAGLHTPNSRLWLFAVQFAVFAIITFWNWKDARPQERPARIWFFSRFFIHAYFLAAFFIFGVFREAPVLGAVALVVLAGDIAVKFYFSKVRA